MLQQQNRYDPRPDITKDHNVWLKLLRHAEEVDNTGYNLLHYLRCMGCKLKVFKGKLKLDLEKSHRLLDQFIDEEELKSVEQKQQALQFGIDKYERDRRVKENLRKQKKKSELRVKAVEKVKSEILKPNIEPLKNVIGTIQKEVRKIHNREKGIDIHDLNRIWGE